MPTYPDLYQPRTVTTPTCRNPDVTGHENPGMAPGMTSAGGWARSDAASSRASFCAFTGHHVRDSCARPINAVGTLRSTGGDAQLAPSRHHPHLAAEPLRALR